MFCQKCGTQLPDGSSFCIGCGASTTPGGAQPGAAPSPSSSGLYFSKTMKYIEGSFKNPAKNVQALSKETSGIWILLESVKFLVCFFAVMFYVLAWELDYEFGSGLLGTLIVYFGTFGIHFLMSWFAAVQMAKLRVPLTAILNISAISSFMMIPSLLLAGVFSFIWIPLGTTILVTGCILSAVIFTENVRSSGIFGSNTIWKNTLVLTVTYAAGYLLFYACQYIALGGALGL